jgi:hypothetical protein
LNFLERKKTNENKQDVGSGSISGSRRCSDRLRFTGATRRPEAQNRIQQESDAQLDSPWAMQSDPESEKQGLAGTDPKKAGADLQARMHISRPRSRSRTEKSHDCQLQNTPSWLRAHLPKK